MSSQNNSSAMECLRCGVCCSKHQAILNDEELGKIADFLAVSPADFISEFTDVRWKSSMNYLIRHNENGCVFLTYDNDVAACTIHPVRPACCRDWIPGPERKECREGMERRQERAVKRTD